jgi:hypothetical protein
MLLLTAAVSCFVFASAATGAEAAKDRGEPSSLGQDWRCRAGLVGMIRGNAHMPARTKRGWLLGLMIAALGTSACAVPETPQLLVDSLADRGEGVAPPRSVAAYHRLKKMGLDAFEMLVQNAGDGRPACPCFQLETQNRTTVGETCLALIGSQVERYSYSKSGPHYLDTTNLSAWWKKSKGKPLVELQLEAIEWTLAEIQKDIEAYKARETNSPTVESYTAEQESRLRSLREAHKQLKKP